MRRLLVAAWLLAAPAASGADVVLEVFGGSALQANTRTTVRQEGERDLDFTARWETHPFEGSPYYAVRAGLWSGNAGWELQFLHHKAYLADPPAEVQRLELTHGFNVLTLGRAFRLRSGLELRAGIGPVVTHTESVVRGLYGGDSGATFGDGYDLSGAALMAGAGGKWPIFAGLFATANVEATGAWVRVKVARGTADVPNLALHGLLGLGWKF